MQSHGRGTWRGWISLAGALILGAVLLVAGYAKLLEPGAFAEQIRLEKLDFLFSASTVAIIALGLEVGLGVALLLGVRSLWILVPSSALVAFFVFLTGRNYWLVSQGLRDPDATCGCFGSLLERSPSEAFWQDMLLLVPPLLLALFMGRDHWLEFPGKRILVALIAGLITVAFAWNSSDLHFAEEAARIADSVESSDFHLSNRYQLKIDGKTAETTRIYESASNPAILVLGSEIQGGILIDPRDRNVRRLDDVTGEDSGFKIEEAESYPSLGEFQLTPKGIAFQLEGREVLLSFRDREDSGR